MTKLISLLQSVEACTLCSQHLPLGPRPVVRISSSARILIIGQAPGTKVHASGIPWDDASGRRLRQWMNVSDELFYNREHIAIMPMGFCYPGKGKSGDLPPRPECAATWHQPLRELMPHIKLTLLIGQYAQNYYLQDHYRTLTERLQHWRDFPAGVIALPHPSPRNQLWLKKNPWFEEDVVPFLRTEIRSVLGSDAVDA